MFYTHCQDVYFSICLDTLKCQLWHAAHLKFHLSWLQYYLYCPSVSVSCRTDLSAYDNWLPCHKRPVFWGLHMFIPVLHRLRLALSAGIPRVWPISRFIADVTCKRSVRTQHVNRNPLQSFCELYPLSTTELNENANIVEPKPYFTHTRRRISRPGKRKSGIVFGRQ